MASSAATALFKGPNGKGCSEKDHALFATILTSMPTNPEVDWDVVANKVGYSAGRTAKARFIQIKTNLGFIEGLAPAVPATPEVHKNPKKSEVGSGTSIAPSKVRKPVAKKVGKKVNDAKTAKMVANTELENGENVDGKGRLGAEMEHDELNDDQNVAVNKKAEKKGARKVQKK